MIARIVFPLLLCLGLASCSNNGPTKPVQLESEHRVMLRHIVLLDLKEICDESDKAYVISSLEKLKGIETVARLEVSERLNTQDPRLIGGFDLMLYMEFEGLASLKSYTQDKFHLQIREQIKPYLAAKPKVIDSRLP